MFEGPDGVGKTSIVKDVLEKLRDSSVNVTSLSFPGKQEGTLGKLIYDFHHQPSSFGVCNVHPASLQMLHVAAHIDAITNRILPLLRAGNIILLDRYWWSTIIYGKKADVKQEVLNAMIDIENHFWDKHLPNCVFLLSRTKSLKNELTQEEWNNIKREYTQLKNREEEKYPIFEVSNETTLEATSTLITQKILEITNHADTT